MFPAIAKILREKYHTPSHTDTEGNLDIAEMKALNDTKENRGSSCER